MEGHHNHTSGFVTAATLVIGYNQEQATKCCHEERVIVEVLEGRNTSWTRETAWSVHDQP